MHAALVSAAVRLGRRPPYMLLPRLQGALPAQHESCTVASHQRMLLGSAGHQQLLQKSLEAWPLHWREIGFGSSQAHSRAYLCKNRVSRFNLVQGPAAQEVRQVAGGVYYRSCDRARSSQDERALSLGLDDDRCLHTLLGRGLRPQRLRCDDNDCKSCMMYDSVMIRYTVVTYQNLIERSNIRRVFVPLGSSIWGSLGSV